jgi:hypothetical protein
MKILQNFVVPTFNNFSLMMQLRELGEKAGYKAVCNEWPNTILLPYLEFSDNSILRENENSFHQHLPIFSIEKAIQYLQSVIDLDSYKPGDWLVIEEKNSFRIFQFDGISEDGKVSSLCACNIELRGNDDEVGIVIFYKRYDTETYSDNLKNYRKATIAETGFYRGLINKFKHEAEREQFKDTYLTAE